MLKEIKGTEIVTGVYFSKKTGLIIEDRNITKSEYIGYFDYFGSEDWENVKYTKYDDDYTIDEYIIINKEISFIPVCRDECYYELIVGNHNTDKWCIVYYDEYFYFMGESCDNTYKINKLSTILGNLLERLKLVLDGLTYGNKIFILDSILREYSDSNLERIVIKEDSYCVTFDGILIDINLRNYNLALYIL